MTWKYGDKTCPIISNLDVELTDDELKEFWDRAWAMGLVITMPVIVQMPSRGTGGTLNE
jgi:hypothetical protein